MLMFLNKKSITKLSCFLFSVFCFLFFTFDFTNFQFSTAFALEQGDLWGNQTIEQNVQVELGLNKEDPRVIIAGVIRIFLGFLGVIALLLIMYGGFLIMMSDGDEEKVRKGRDTLTRAVIGLIIILMSFAIATFVLNSLADVVSGPGGSEGPGGGPGFGGIGSIGGGMIVFHYPERDQKDVPRNTSIIVTFREEIDAGTICDKITSDKNCEVGAKIVKENIRIFKNDDKDSCVEGSPITNCEASNVIDVNVYSRDNKTFVFAPISYLGVETGNTLYSVILSGNISKKDGANVFAFNSSYEWSFEVSDKIDLTPPQVLEVSKSGIFPLPDNEQDQVNKVKDNALQAQGSIQVNGQPSAYIAPSQNPVAEKNPKSATWDKAFVQGTYVCSDNGEIIVSINSNSTVNVSGVSGLISGDDISDGQASLGCGLSVTPENSFQAGNSWKINVVARKVADTLKVDQTIYSFGDDINLGGNLAESANNIAQILNNRSDVDAQANGSTINITAKIAGKQGNNIELSTSNNTALVISPMSGGADEVDEYIQNGRKDNPRNSIIQINFNEEINPVFISGAATEVKDYIRVVNANINAKSQGESCMFNKDCLSFICKNSVCIGNEFLEGDFMVSNQYRSVEFISNDECGLNSCDEKIYCLPKNSNLKVEIVASKLQTCAQAICSSRAPYSSCVNNRCFNESESKNYPQSEFPLSGIVDVAMNSLDGNRNNNAQGPISFYDENTKSPTHGDNYSWSFFISDEINVSSPIILETDAKNNEINVKFTDPVVINFNKLMMSSSLITGDIIIDNGRETIKHKLINLWSLANLPIGYWATNENIDTSDPLDGNADITRVFINHTKFNSAIQYRAQAGSGIKDIYQNCFKPSSGPACSGAEAVNILKPSCCSGVRSEKECK